MKNLLLSLALIFGMSVPVSAAIVDGCADIEGAQEWVAANDGDADNFFVADDSILVARITLALSVLGATIPDDLNHYVFFHLPNDFVAIGAFNEDGWSCTVYPLNPQQADIVFKMMENPKEGSL